MNSARAAAPGAIQIVGLPRLFAHLEVRTRQLRQRFSSAARSVVEKTVEQATNVLPELLLERWKREPESFDDMMQKQLLDAGLGSLFSKELADQTRRLAPEAMERIRPELVAALAGLQAVLPTKVEESAKGAHIDALNKSIAPDIRTEHYERLSYSLVEFSVREVILGDSAVIFEVRGPKRFKPMSEKDDVIVAAMLPITSCWLLVGSVEPYTVDLEQIRSAIARCSYEFFIASHYSDANEQLIGEIGRDSVLLTESQLDEMVRTGFDQFRGWQQALRSETGWNKQP